MQEFLHQITPTLAFPLLTLAGIAIFFCYYWNVLAPQPRKGTLEWIAQRQARESRKGWFTLAGTCHPMVRGDILPLLLITVLYAVTAFWNLGATSAPQSFARFYPQSPVVLELPEETTLGSFLYYPGLGTGDYNVELSADGNHWSTLWTTENAGGSTLYYWASADGFEPSYALPQHYADLFKWLTITPDNPLPAKYLRITGRADNSWIELGELALFDETGARIFFQQAGDTRQPGPLGDEQTVVPERQSWYNSTYFDEIYHARTALEHINGVYPYEITHPPLGKLILGLGIQMAGMTPFGWRFMGVLFGVLMLPLLYVFLKNLFGKTAVAACGTTLFAADFMHLTQTRIATIDTYGVFFILAMYFFLYRYLTLPAGTPLRKGAVPLLLSGLCWGLGAASKWTVIYGAVGLALIYFIGLWQKIRSWPLENSPAAPQPKLGPWLIRTLAFSVLCFVVIPAVIYCLAYIPYAQAKGDLSVSGVLEAMWENQKYMLNYHNGVTATHPYSSRWYQWIVDGRPILYYLDSTSVPGMKSAFGAFSNPIVCWGGLLAILSVGVQLIRRRCGKALFILIGYFSQLAPWFFIGRTTFEYHYFPSIVFLVLALAYLFSDLLEREHKRARPAVYGLTGASVLLYLLFYPVLTGIMVSSWFSTTFLKWLPSWPF